MRSQWALSFIFVLLLGVLAILAPKGLVPAYSTEQTHETIFHVYPHVIQENQIQAYASAPDTRALGEAVIEDGKLYVGADEKFALTIQWYVEGKGFLWLTMDRDGEFYDPSTLGSEKLHLNYELALSRVKRNERIIKRYQQDGWSLSDKISNLQEQAQNFLKLAAQADGLVKARIADLSLSAAVKAGEEVELSWARHQQRRPDFKPPMIGIDSRHYLWTNVDKANEHFPQLFDYATITHYLTDDWFPPFEPKEGDLRWGIRDEVYRWLEGHGAVVQARPVFWPHESVMPDWLRQKSFAELKTYVKNHATAMVNHWGDRITRWEVANEMHDWANVHKLTPAQITELIHIATRTIRELQPSATLIINHTSIFGDYAGLETPFGEQGKRRTPYLFIRDLIEAGVDFDVIGLQLYEPERDLSEIVRWIERFESFGKELMLTEAGVPSYYEHEEPLIRGQTEWSEAAQARWAEDIFRVLGARPSFKVLCWYDLTDFRSFTHNGGVLTDDGYPKEVFSLLHGLKKEWQRDAEKF